MAQSKPTVKGKNTHSKISIQKQNSFKFYPNLKLFCKTILAKGNKIEYFSI